MTADAARLRRQVHSWAARVHADALSDMPDRVRPDAPISRQVPGGRPPGELRRSIDSRPGINTGARMRGTLVATAPQARYTDEGTEPHRIDGNPLLVFWWGKVGRTVFFRHVNHPGTRAQNWWRPALRRHWGPALRAAARRHRL